MSNICIPMDSAANCPFPEDLGPITEPLLFIRLRMRTRTNKTYWEYQKIGAARLPRHTIGPQYRELTEFFTHCAEKSPATHQVHVPAFIGNILGV